MRHILVVDVSAPMRSLIISALGTLHDVTFSEASNGLEALERLIVANVDLMTLPFDMPDMYGSEVVGFVRTQERYQRLSIIVFAEAADTPDPDALRGMGATAYIGKPFAPERLVQQAAVLLQPS